MKSTNKLLRACMSDTTALAKKRDITVILALQLPARARLEGLDLSHACDAVIVGRLAFPPAEINFSEGVTYLVCMRAPKKLGSQDMYRKTCQMRGKKQQKRSAAQIASLATIYPFFSPALERAHNLSCSCMLAGLFRPFAFRICARVSFFCLWLRS